MMGPREVFRTIKEASPFDLFLISCLLLPFIFESWISALKELNAEEWIMYASLVIILVGYIVGVALMLFGARRTKRKEDALKQVTNYLNSRDFRIMSFDRVRSAINGSYSDSFLDALVDEFPAELRRARLKGGRPGLGIIEVSNAEDEE